MYSIGTTDQSNPNRKSRVEHSEDCSELTNITNKTTRKTIAQRLEWQGASQKLPGKEWARTTRKAEPADRPKPSKQLTERITTNQPTQIYLPPTRQINGLKYEGNQGGNSSKGVPPLVEDSIPPLVPQTIFTIPNHWYTHPVAQ